MTLLDVLVICVLVGGAAWPAVSAAVPRIFSPRPAARPAEPAEGSPIEAWRQAWASTIITLIDQIEGGHGHFEDEKVALRLAKELLWEVIGGDGPMPSKSK